MSWRTESPRNRVKRSGRPRRQNAWRVREGTESHASSRGHGEAIAVPAPRSGWYSYLRGGQRRSTSVVRAWIDQDRRLAARAEAACVRACGGGGCSGGSERRRRRRRWSSDALAWAQIKRGRLAARAGRLSASLAGGWPASLGSVPFRCELRPATQLKGKGVGGGG